MGDASIEGSAVVKPIRMLAVATGVLAICAAPALAQAKQPPRPFYLVGDSLAAGYGVIADIFGKALGKAAR